MARNFSSPSMSIAPGVVDRVITIAASEVEGVASVCSFRSCNVVSQFVSCAKIAPVETAVNENGKLDVKIHIACKYGYSIPEVANKVHENIADALFLQTGIEIGKVDVSVEGVTFNKVA